MSTLHVSGIVWDLAGMKDGKGILSHKNCTVSFDKDMGVFLFKQDNALVLARELRGDCIREATDCILDTYAKLISPSWEQPNGSQEAS